MFSLVCVFVCVCVCSMQGHCLETEKNSPPLKKNND